jgi:hypothetical protein
MSLESFAFEKLKSRHPNLVKNSLKRVLRVIDQTMEPAESVSDYATGFVPDATVWDEANRTISLLR